MQYRPLYLCHLSQLVIQYIEILVGNVGIEVGKDEETQAAVSRLVRKEHSKIMSLAGTESADMIDATYKCSVSVLHGHSMDGPCRSRRPNQEDSEPIRDSAPCPSRDGGGGPPGQLPGAAGCWPACSRLGRNLPVPLLAHGDVDARAFKLRSRRAGTREGYASAPYVDDLHGRHPSAQRLRED